MASDAQKKVSENMPQGGNVQDMASDAQKKVSESMPSSGQAQDTGKTYLDQATEMASNAAKVVSDTLSGTIFMQDMVHHSCADSCQQMPPKRSPSPATLAANRRSYVIPQQFALSYPILEDRTFIFT